MYNSNFNFHYFLLFFLVRWVWPILIMVGAWWFLIYIPQKKIVIYRKKLQALLVPGAVVKTTTHEQGVIIFVYEVSVIVQLKTGQKFEILKHAIAQVLDAKS